MEPSWQGHPHPHWLRGLGVCGLTPPPGTLGPSSKPGGPPLFRASSCRRLRPRRGSCCPRSGGRGCSAAARGSWASSPAPLLGLGASPSCLPGCSSHWPQSVHLEWETYSWGERRSGCCLLGGGHSCLADQRRSSPAGRGFPSLEGKGHHWKHGESANGRGRIRPLPQATHTSPQQKKEMQKILIIQVACAGAAPICRSRAGGHTTPPSLPPSQPVVCSLCFPMGSTQKGPPNPERGRPATLELDGVLHTPPVMQPFSVQRGPGAQHGFRDGKLLGHPWKEVGKRREVWRLLPTCQANPWVLVSTPTPGQRNRASEPVLELWGPEHVTGVETRSPQIP